jgi:predicted RNase H-like HicB family nuclease
MAVLDECPSLRGFSSQGETFVDTPEMTEAAIGSHLEVEAALAPDSSPNESIGD